MNRDEAADEYYKLAAFVQAYDSFFLNIKAWGVTVTAGAIAAGFSSGVASSKTAQVAVFGVGFLLSGTFWTTEAMFKMLQLAHIRRIAELEQMLAGGATDIAGPAYLSSFSAYQSVDRQSRRWKRVLFWPHVMLPHIVFASVSAALAVFAMIRS